MSTQTDLEQFALTLSDFMSLALNTGPEPGSLSALNARFEPLALELFSLQHRANTAYRRYCESIGAEAGDISNWRAIPAVPPAAFRETELTSLPAAERTVVFHSSGTTGQRPSRHFHHTSSLALYDRGAWLWFRHGAGLTGADVGSLAMLTPPPESTPHSSLVRMLATLREKLGIQQSEYFGIAAADGGWETDSSRAAAWLEKVSTGGKPVLILGTAFAFVHLLEWLRGRGRVLRMPSGSRVMETGGYKGRSRALPKPELYGLITERLGIASEAIFSEYGMSELSSQAYDVAPSPDNGGPSRRFRFPPWVRTRIVSPETGKDVAEGEAGLLRIFDLANVWSVMAIQTEDLAIWRGRGFELIGRAQAAEPRGCSLRSVEQE